MKMAKMLITDIFPFFYNVSKINFPQDRHLFVKRVNNIELGFSWIFTFLFHVRNKKLCDNERSCKIDGNHLVELG